MFGGELVPVDGSKFKAVNSKKQNVVKEKAVARIKEIEKQIEEYMNLIYLHTGNTVTGML
ncbi:hypothetical protein UNSWDHB_2068 [Dehalobacter sp. UNSWDHB]|nr:hypothetical protein DCF50_p1705 [Dehalobacter sp. CF]EQB20619.1 hypothetical protein UNSWDHB_2068 [Dehalobacter sp. UNSWDHB]